MLNKLVQKRNMVFIVLAVIFLMLWTLTMLFGNVEDIAKVLVPAFVLPFAVYGFARLLYKVVSMNASFKAMRVFFCFFLTAGTLGTIMMIAAFIAGFSNGLAPTLGACEGLIIATLDKAKGILEMEREK